MSGSSYVGSAGTSTQILDLLTDRKTAPGFITTRCYADAAWPMFTHTAMLDTLKPGDTMRFLTVDSALDFAPKAFNALPRFEQVEMGSFCAQLCPPRELGLKIDQELIKGHEDVYMAAFDKTLSDTLSRLNQSYYRQAVNQLISGVDPMNTGNTAGVSGQIQLGTVGAPLQINVSAGTAPEAIYRQILDVAVALASVRSQQEIGDCVDSWKLLVHEELLINFAYAQSMAHCCDMSNTVLQGGVRTYNNLFGNTTMSSPLMPKIATATGFKTPIILTHSQASAFTGGITSAVTDEEFFMKRFILTETRGGIVMKPKHVYVAWIEVVR
jgi:hypothetical protein